MNTGHLLEYYNTTHYSLTFDTWKEAWLLAKDAIDAKGKAVGDRAAGELVYMPPSTLKLELNHPSR